jgi:biopolymer transport protein ExbD
MSQKRRYLDVWLVDSNTVYREVPFDVVADWIQQSRLLADDRLRPSGTAQWLKVGESPEFSPYVPQPQAHAVNDEAEALGAVQLDFQWKRRHDDEEDDVDMIPLIDVSLVLLIFFIMTTTGVTSAALAGLPEAVNGLVVANPQLIWIGIEESPEGAPVFSIGAGEARPAPEDTGLVLGEVLAKLRQRLEPGTASAEVTVRAHKDIEAGIVRELTVELARLPKVRKRFITVSEPSKP